MKKKPDAGRGCTFGFSMVTVSPGPRYMYNPAPLWVVGLEGLDAAAALPGSIFFIRTRTDSCSTQLAAFVQNKV